jgi:hypothetical protein
MNGVKLFKDNKNPYMYSLLLGKICTVYPSVFKKLEVVNELLRLHSKFMAVPLKTLSLFVQITVFVVLLMNWNLSLLLEIPDIL